MTEHFLMEFDKSGAEWVVVAYLSGDANMISVVEEGISPHVKTGHLISGAPISLIEREAKIVGQTTDPQRISELRQELPELLAGNYFLPRSMSIRQCGKKSNHSLNYDEGYRVFAMLNEIDETESKRIVNLYKTVAYPNIPVWHTAVQEELRRNDRSLSNCFGRKRRFLGAWDRELWKAAYAFLPQSTVVDMVNGGMCLTYRDNSSPFRKLDLLAQTHDSITTQYPISDFVSAAKAAYKIAEVYLSPTCEYGAKKFKIKTDLKVGSNWGKMLTVPITSDIKVLASGIEDAWRRSKDAKQSKKAA